MIFQHGYRDEFVSSLFTHYKLVCLQELRQALAVEAPLACFSMATIAKAFALAFEDVSTLPMIAALIACHETRN